MALRDSAPVGHLIVAALGTLAIAIVEQPRVDDTPPSDRSFRMHEVRPECQRVARMSAIAAAGWSVRNRPLCANKGHAMSSVEAYFEARATDCIDALSSEAVSVPRWLSTGASIESAFCIGELDWSDADEIVGTLARATELLRDSGPLTYAGPIEATAIHRFVIDRAPDKLDACVAHAWRDAKVRDLDVDVRLTLTPGGTVATASGSSVADCIAMIVGGIQFEPVVRDVSLDIPFRVHALDDGMLPDVTLGSRETSDPTRDRMIGWTIEHRLWKFRDCYTRALRIGDTAMREGDLVLTFDTTSTDVSNARASGLDPVLDRCVAEAVSRRDYPVCEITERLGSRVTHVRQKLRFRLRKAH